MSLFALRIQTETTQFAMYYLIIVYTRYICYTSMILCLYLYFGLIKIFGNIYFVGLHKDHRNMPRAFIILYPYRKFIFCLLLRETDINGWRMLLVYVCCNVQLPVSVYSCLFRPCYRTATVSRLFPYIIRFIIIFYTCVCHTYVYTLTY